MKSVIAVLVIIVVAGGFLFLLKQRAATHEANKPEFSEEEFSRHCEAKHAALEQILGPMHPMVRHSMIPFAVGGAVDMYCFPNGIPGTGFATMELIEPDGSGPKPNRIGTYELVAFTRQRMPAKEEEKDDHPFNKMQRRACGILSTAGFYSYNEVLNPGDTCEVPGEEREPNVCLLLDEYAPDGKTFEIDGKKHCLLLCIEVFRSEMEYAMEHGSAAVIEKLKKAGHYPYSDLDREPVY